ncbi:MAG: Alkyl hydroperoxide reductase subunit C-like protein, partial [uncultured Rubrobacteraceae bacterium]
GRRGRGEGTRVRAAERRLGQQGIAGGGEAGGASRPVLLPRRLVERLLGPDEPVAGGDGALRRARRKGNGRERRLPLVPQGLRKGPRDRVPPALGLRARGDRAVRRHPRGRLPEARLLRHRQGGCRTGEEGGRQPPRPARSRRRPRRRREGPL